MSVPEFFASLPVWLGTLPQLVSAGGIVTIVGMLLKYRVAIRTLVAKLAMKKAELQLDDDEDLRSHWVAELKRVGQAQRDCEGREVELRKRVRKLEDQVTGLQRILVYNSASGALDLSAMSADVQQAAIRVLENIAKGSPNGESDK